MGLGDGFAPSPVTGPCWSFWHVSALLVGVLPLRTQAGLPSLERGPELAGDILRAKETVGKTVREEQLSRRENTSVCPYR